ncbi:hypothetical protein [Pseudoduganella danionis]|uniref:hypothetical protein n=1 Tax=Pseudoduganella danionis TaxID=1890295 RepID=UPI0035ADED6D
MKKISLCIAVLLFPLMALAQIVESKGAGTLSYSGPGVPQEVKDKAYVKAQVAAIERYFAASGEAEAQNFDAIQDKIEENLEKFILNTTVLNEQDMSSQHKYSVAVRVELNLARLRNTLRASSAAGKANNGAKSQLVYLFVGREAASVRTFDARVLQRTEAEVTRSGSAKGTERAAVQVESGGSSQQKADEVNYRLLPITNTATAITNLFSQGGYQVVDPAYVIGDGDFKAVNKDFSSGNDLSPATLRSVVATLRKNRIPYLVIATLDAGAPSKDPATGLARSAVNVTARVLDLSNQFPREVASVPAKSYFGIGPDNSVARDQGLKEAALAAAREVISRLNAVGVQ